MEILPSSRFLQQQVRQVKEARDFSLNRLLTGDLP